jgi:putative ABC transport system permease protein
MLLLLGILGVFSLCMSGFLVINTVSAQVTQQVHQIGIMKAVGGSPRQLVGMSLATILGFCLLALVVAIPLGVIGALELISYSTHLLDFDTSGFGLSPGVLGLELGAGVAVPFLAAAVPIITGNRITVREALASYGTGGRSEGAVNLDHGPRWLAALPQPLLLSLGNTVRRKGRLTLTLTAMILGGAIFIAVLSVRASLLHTLDDIFSYRNYDVQIKFSQPYNASRVQRETLSVPGVVKAEGWGLATAQRAGATGIAATDVAVVAPPAGSTLIKPVVLQGRWLRPGDRQSMVVNSDVLTNEPDLGVGRSVRFSINGRETTWTVVGIVRGVQAGPTAYVSYQALTHITGETGLVERVQVMTAQHDAANESRIARALEVHLKHAGLLIDSTQTTVDQRAILAANFDVIVVFLFVMAVLLGVVGGLGLMGTMSINVLERTREIGIMRAIGASNRETLQIVMVEGIIIAALSWVVATVVGVALSPALSGAVGSAFLHSSLDYTFSATGAILWLFAVLLIAGLASFVPAWRASRLTVRDVLAYE